MRFDRAPQLSPACGLILEAVAKAGGPHLISGAPGLPIVETWEGCAHHYCPFL